MPKEDGRLKPADPQELANLKGKQFKCTSCGEVAVFTDAEFAEAKECSSCGAPMEEMFGGKASTGRLD